MNAKQINEEANKIYEELYALKERITDLTNKADDDDAYSEARDWEHEFGTIFLSIGNGLA